MSLPSLFTAFSGFLHSPQFRHMARHADAGNAFVRRRKLPLPALVAVMLSGMRKSVQTELDEFFAHLKEQAQLVHHVSEQAFAKARAKLSVTAVPALNDWLVARAASADQIAFGVYLPGAEMMLAASLHSVHEGERQMLFQHLDRLSEGDLLLMDRGYPSRWLVAALNARGIGFCMRVEKAGNAGLACVRDFLRSGENERIVTLAAPDRRDADDYECPATAQTVRLVRHVASTGKVRVLMTNLPDPVAFPCAEFGDLYHQRWRIEEAFKRLKHRLNLEHVSGLSQQAALHDFAAKIVCDNLQSLATQAALRQAPLPATRHINRAAAHSILKPLWPALLLGADIATRLRDALQLIAGRTYSHRPDIIKSKPTVARPKPHKSMSQKPC